MCHHWFTVTDLYPPDTAIPAAPINAHRKTVSSHDHEQNWAHIDRDSTVLCEMWCRLTTDEAEAELKIRTFG